jgi:hypothetical protein
MNCIVATTTKLGNETTIESVRTKLTLETICNCTQLGLGIICLDAASPPDLVVEMRKAAGMVISATNLGMGPSRREAIAYASLQAKKRVLPILWVEPEQSTFIAHIPEAIKAMAKGKTNIVMFNRASLKSYPPEQAHADDLVRLAANYLLKVDLDFMFGPVLFDLETAEYFLRYKGEHGDKQDSIHIPKLRALQAGASYKVLDIDYVHPKEQTEAETGNMDVFIKRINQAQVVITGMLSEIAASGVGRMNR